jgi:hypothetical protein
MQTVQMAAAFEDIGSHLFGIGTDWAERGLKLALLTLLVVKIIQKFSVKAGIGAALGYVIIMGIYNSQNPLAEAFKEEITSVSSAPSAVVRIDDRDALPLVPGGAAGGARSERETA